MTGVVDFVDANDIPGINDWRLAPSNETMPGMESMEEVFSSGKVEYAGQAVGLVVATTREIARAAAATVTVVYTNEGKVVVDVGEAMEDPNNVALMGYPGMFEYGDVDGEMEACDRQISGQFRMGSQYHYHMETHVVQVTPLEDGFDVTVPTQTIDFIQKSVSRVLNVPANRSVGVLCSHVFSASNLGNFSSVASTRL